MVPLFQVPASEVPPVEQVFTPLLVRQLCRMEGTDDVGLAGVGELRLVAAAAPGAFDQQQKPSPSMGDAGGTMLVDKVPAGEALQRKGLVQSVGPVLSHGVGEYPTRPRGRLVATRTPAAIEVEALNRGQADDRAGVRAGVDDASPLPQHADPAETGKHLDYCTDRVLQGRRAAALAIAVVGVDPGAAQQLAAVGLAQIGVNRIGHDNHVQHRFEGFRHPCLERVTLQRQAQTGHAGDIPGVARSYAAYLPGADKSSAGLHARNRAAFAANTYHLTILNDFDPDRVGGAGITPGQGVVAGGATPALQRSPQNRVASVGGDIDAGHQLLDSFRGEEFAVDAVEKVGVDPPPDVAQFLQGMSQAQQAALTEHQVEVQLPSEVLPQLQRELVDVGSLVPEVVGADYFGIASRVATAHIALFDHGHIAEPLFFDQVVGRGQTMSATADDYCVVGGFWFGAAPGALPVFVVAERVSG